MSFFRFQQILQAAILAGAVSIAAVCMVFSVYVITAIVWTWHW